MNVTVPNAFLIGTDQAITVEGVTDEAGDPVTGATFAGDLFDSTGNAVVEGITFTETATPSNYRGELPDDVALVENRQYSLIASAVKDGRKLTMRIKRPARYIEG